MITLKQHYILRFETGIGNYFFLRKSSDFSATNIARIYPT